ncbi:MAG: PAS domain S-box protein [Thermodesulfovibrionales bacterium]
MKILIVDDDPDARNILKLIIEMHGHEAIEASDGLQGLEKTKANRPDLIISDILMPRMDGFQFLREANSDKNLSAIPFVFYSSTYAGEEEIELAFSSGAAGFIVKPKSPEKFWEELNNILSKREEEKNKKAKPIKDEEYLKKYSHVVSAKLEEKVKELEKTLEERKKVEEALKSSEEKFRTLFESANDAIFILDPEGNFIDLNSTAYERLGYTREEMLSKHISQFDPPEFAAKVPERLEQITKYGKAVFESAHIRKDGTVMPVEINSRIIDFEGRKAFFSIIRDITERKRAEEKLTETTQTIQSLINASPLAIIVVDPEGHVLIWNSAAENIFGWNEREAVGQFNPIIPREQLEEFRAFRERVLRGESFNNIETRRQKKDGSLIDVSLSTAPLRDAKGTVIGVLGIIADITDRKKMEEKIFQISQDWEETFNSITDMVTVHDKDWNIIRANKAAEKMLGLPFLEKTSGTKCFKYYHGTEKPPEGCPSCGCLKNGKSALFEIFEPHLNMFIEIRAIPRFDSNNNLIGLIHVVRDITERKKAEEKLNQFLKDITRAKTEWEITFDNVTELIALVDKDFRIVRCNKVFAEFSDKQINEIPGSKFTDIFPMGEEDAGYLAERIQKEESSEWMEVTAADRWFYLSHQPVMAPDSLFVYSVIIATDITALKHSEQELMGSEGELKKRVKELEKFYEMAVGRELKMKEMKKEIKDLRENLSLYKTGN